MILKYEDNYISTHISSTQGKMATCSMSEGGCVEKACEVFLKRNRTKRRLCTTDGVTYYPEQVDQHMRRYKAKIRRKRQKK